jgi:hypothetical protein
LQRTSHVRFTPNSDRESGFPATVMSALIAAITAMAKMLDEPERIAVGEIFRDAADIIEKRRERVPIA